MSQPKGDARQASSAEARDDSALKQRLRELPHRPGVYLFKDRLNRVIYVGKARDLHKRVHQYFHPSRQMNGDRKTRALVESIRDLEVHTVKSEAESVLLEGKLIKEYRPKYNVSFRDDKRFLLVRVDLKTPYPRFTTVRNRKEDGARYFGPFPHSGSLRSVLNAMKKKFGLRSCTPVIPNENDYRHCLDHVIKNCSAPCIAKITRAEYMARVQEACQFLEGKSGDMLRQIEADMKEAAERLDFEKAARLRNLLDDLRKTTTPIKRFRHQFVTTVKPQEDARALQKALSLEASLSRIECFDIANISSTHIVASMVSFKDGKPDNANYRRYRIKTVEGQDDFASMAEVVRRRYQRVLGERIRRPDLIVVDGGKGQLNAACRELRTLGLEALPIIGLAKKHEEVFRPGDPVPLHLDPSSGALRLLQRIRDEAHRFANSYHALLLKQRLSESILDECPGVSAHRKKLLLSHFGSIDRIRKASAKEISEIPGIGIKSAEQVVAFLEQTKEKGPAKELGDSPSSHDDTSGTTVYQLK